MRLHVILRQVGVVSGAIALLKTSVLFANSIAVCEIKSLEVQSAQPKPEGRENINKAKTQKQPQTFVLSSLLIAKRIGIEMSVTDTVCPGTQ